MKHCPTCKETLSLDHFWKGQSSCIPCSKMLQKTRWNSRTPLKRLEQHLKYKYGVTHSEFLKAWEKQGGCCAICKSELPDLMTYDNRKRGYAIDHNHDTGAFRGILCLTCNTLLGMAKDSKVVLESAIEYLNERGSYGPVLIDNMQAARKKK